MTRTKETEVSNLAYKKYKKECIKKIFRCV